jgi:WD repeat-containing protein 44
MQSLGRVGRILSGSLDPAVMNVKSDSQVIQRDTPISQESPPAMSPRVESPSKASSSDEAKGKNEDSHSQCSNYSGIIISKTTILQEPDVIASTKLAHSKTTDSVSIILISNFIKF